MRTDSQSLYAHLRSHGSTVNPPSSFLRQGSSQILSHRRRNIAPVGKCSEVQELTHRFGGAFGANLKPESTAIGTTSP